MPIDRASPRRHALPLRRGEYLFRAGDPLRAVFAVRSGSVKTFTSSGDDDERVTGFHLPGELIGLDAIGSGVYPCSARALETSSVCEVAYEGLEDLSMKIRGLQRQLLRLMSREIHHDEKMMVLLGGMAAEGRLAALLSNIAARFSERGFSSRTFRLSMSRNEIGSYLGLAVETVSRLFTRLQAEGLLSVQHRQVMIHDMDRLQRMAGAFGDGAAHRR
ncbi:MAG: fumarate/nitrate reduction transcriptional regulator Fnr [Gammaproteobacteria bacterium]|nr:fumarate/nitrate reduction transcriptional regulator Fnr [Gammaproteobacteria bacterium]